MKQMDETFRKKCISKEGSYLEKRRSIGGVGAGIVAGSAVLLAAAILLFLMLAASGDADLIVMGAVLAGGIGLFCLAFILLGIVLNKKRRSGYMEYFVKHAGYPREELEAFDREVLLPDTLYSTTDGKLRGNSALSCDLVTRNWLSMGIHDPVRVTDVAAAFYADEVAYAGNQWEHVMFLLLSHGQLVHQQCKEEYAMDLIQEIKKRNPGLICARCFKADGKLVDCIKEPKLAARLYCEAMGAR